MASSRKDPKGRALWKGESYRKKQEMYVYSYTTAEGKRKCLYSKDLKSLREKEQKALKNTFDGIDGYLNGNATVTYVYEKYIATRDDLRDSTCSNYKFHYDKHVRDGFGRRKIGSVVHSDVVAFYLELFREKNLSVYTVHTINNLLSMVFDMAVRDSIIRYNPVKGAISEGRRKANAKGGARCALTLDQQRAFMGCLDLPENAFWSPVLTVLLGTGLRVGELIGLRWDDVDFDNEFIDVNHEIVTYSHYENGKVTRAKRIDKPKTEKGNRKIPMMSEVKDALIEMEKRDRVTGISKKLVFDGMTNFIFASQKGSILDPKSLNGAIHRMTLKYNHQEELNARREDREPAYLPHFTCHGLRHTFCTRLCEVETNLKSIQTIMGHSDIQTTLNIYADVMESTKKESLNKLSDYFYGKESGECEGTTKVS